MKRHPPKSPQRMTLKELDEATRELDEEFVIDTFGSMTPGAKAAWARARRKRPSKGVQPRSRTVSVTIDHELLRRADDIAKRLQVSRSQLLATGLERVVQATEQLAERHTSKRRKSKPAA